MSLQYLPEPITLSREVLRVSAFGREWELGAGSLSFLFRAAFTLLALAILAWAFAAERRQTA